MTGFLSMRAALLAIAGLWIAVAVGGRQLAFGWLILAPPDSSGLLDLHLLENGLAWGPMAAMATLLLGSALIGSTILERIGWTDALSPAWRLLAGILPGSVLVSGILRAASLPELGLPGGMALALSIAAILALILLDPPHCSARSIASEWIRLVALVAFCLVVTLRFHIFHVTGDAAGVNDVLFSEARLGEIARLGFPTFPTHYHESLLLWPAMFAAERTQDWIDAVWVLNSVGKASAVVLVFGAFRLGLDRLGAIAATAFIAFGTSAVVPLTHTMNGPGGYGILFQAHYGAILATAFTIAALAHGIFGPSSALSERWRIAVYGCIGGFGFATIETTALAIPVLVAIAAAIARSAKKGIFRNGLLVAAAGAGLAVITFDYELTFSRIGFVALPALALLVATPSVISSFRPASVRKLLCAPAVVASAALGAGFGAGMLISAATPVDPVVAEAFALHRARLFEAPDALLPIVDLAAVLRPDHGLVPFHQLFIPPGVAIRHIADFAQPYGLLLVLALGAAAAAPIADDAGRRLLAVLPLLLAGFVASLLLVYFLNPPLVSVDTLPVHVKTRLLTEVAAAIFAASLLLLGRAALTRRAARGVYVGALTLWIVAPLIASRQYLQWLASAVVLVQSVIG